MLIFFSDQYAAWFRKHCQWKYIAIQNIFQLNILTAVFWHIVVLFFTSNGKTAFPIAPFYCLQIQAVSWLIIVLISVLRTFLINYPSWYNALVCVAISESAKKAK